MYGFDSFILDIFDGMKVEIFFSMRAYFNKKNIYINWEIKIY